MSEGQQPQRRQVISGFIHQHRKDMGKLKAQAIYASHLCKKNCLMGRLDTNQDACFAQCDDWLRKFFQKRRDKNPEMAQQVMNQFEDKLPLIEQNEDLQYQKDYSVARMEISYFFDSLRTEVEEKIAQESGRK